MHGTDTSDLSFNIALTVYGGIIALNLKIDLGKTGMLAILSRLLGLLKFLSNNIKTF